MLAEGTTARGRGSRYSTHSNGLIFAVFEEQHCGYISTRAAGKVYIASSALGMCSFSFDPVVTMPL